MSPFSRPSPRRLAAVVCLLLTTLCPRPLLALPDTLNLTVTVNSQTRHLALTRRSVRAADYTMYTWTTAGGYVAAAAEDLPEVRTYRGTVAEEPNTLVCAVVRPNGRLYVNAFIGKGHWWQLSNVDVSSQLGLPGLPVTIAATLEEAPSADGALVSVPAVAAVDQACDCEACRGGVEAPPSSTFVLSAVNTSPAVIPPVGGIQRFEYAMDLNSDTFASSYGSDLATAVADIEHLFNTYNHWMCRDTLIDVQLSTFVLRQDNFYTADKIGANGSGHLGYLNSIWHQEPLLSFKWDAVHTFSTSLGLPPGVGGIAFQNQIGKDEAASSINALYHENGHNWDAVHLVYGADTMGGNRPHHGPFNIERVLAKRLSEMGEGTFDGSTGTYPDPLHPYALVDIASTPKNTSVDIPVLANDWDANGDTLSIRTYISTTVQGGTVTQVGDVLRYTPASGYVGKDLIYYEVEDSTGLYNLDLVHIEVVDGGLAAHFQFEEGSGATAGDASGNGHVGQLQDTSFASATTQGVVGKAVRPTTGFLFDNRNGMPVALDPSYEHYPIDDDYMFTSNHLDPMDASYSAAFWFKADNFNTTRELLHKEYHSEHKVGFRIYADAGGLHLTVREFNGTLSTRSIDITSPSLVAGKWYHVAMVIDRAAQNVKLYLNATPSASTPSLTAGSFIFQGRKPLTLGLGAAGTVAFDDATIYNKALSEGEITTLFNQAVYPAQDPVPAVGAINQNAAGLTLSWTTGAGGNQHDVYFGASLAAVTAATTGSPEYRGRQAGVTHASGTLASNTRYYWRVDEVTAGNGILKGDTWYYDTTATAGGTFNGQIGYWKFDEGSGASLVDSSGQNHPGSITNTVRVTGLSGGALQFNGSSSVATFGTGPSLSGATDFTVAAWIRTSASSVTQRIIGQRDANEYYGQYTVNVKSNGRVGFQIWNGDSQFDFETTASVNDGQWHHVAAQRQGLTGRIYVDGQLAAEATGSSIRNLTGTIQTAIGKDIRDNNSPFNGIIDEARVWNRALIGGEIYTLAVPYLPVRREFWTGISGSSVSNLTSDPRYPAAPSSTTYAQSLSLPRGYADNFGGRITALLVPPASGSYTFWISSDDASELWLSTDATPANASKIAYITSWSGYQEWIAGTRQSTPRSLVAGQRYYIHALLKEGGGDDHLDVAWSGPGLAQQLIQVPYLESTSAVGGNAAPEFFQDPLALGSVFVRRSLSSSVAGFVADPNAFDTLTFSKVSGPSWLSVSSAGVVSGTPNEAQVGPHSLVVRATDGGGLNDTATVNVTVTDMGFEVEYWDNIGGGTTVASLTGHARYPNSPDERVVLTNLVRTASNRGNSYGVRARAVLVPPSTGSYRFWIASDDEGQLRLGPDDTPVYASAIATVPGFTNPDQFNKYGAQQSAFTNLVAGQRYYLEALMKEGSGGDHLSVAWEGPGISQVVITALVTRIYIPNTAPSLGAATVTKGPAEEGQPFSASLASNLSDPDPLDTHTYAKLSGPDWLSVAANGSLSGTPTGADLGTNLFSVRVRDQRHGGFTNTLSIAVQASPGQIASWLTSHGLSDPNADSDGDGWNNQAEYLANTNPTQPASGIAVTNLVVNGLGQAVLSWNSTQDGGTTARRYDVRLAAGCVTCLVTQVATSLAANGTSTSYVDDLSTMGASNTRFYRVRPAGLGSGPVNPALGVQRVALRQGAQNFVSFSLAFTNTVLAALLPPASLPGATTESAATVVDLWNPDTQSFSTRYWLSTVPGFPGWRVGGGFADANAVAVDQNHGLSLILRAGVGYRTYYLTGTAPTTGSFAHGTLKPGYNLLGARFPSRTPVQGMGLLAAGFQGSTRFFNSDMLLLWNPASGQFDSMHWYHTGTGQWINQNGGGVSSATLEPGQPFLLLRRGASGFDWTESRPYAHPLTGP
jgi:hypothetical protein